MSSESETQGRKLFIGGLNLETTTESLRQYFESYGEIEDCIVMEDKMSKRSRGFGFVTFTTKEDADKASEKREQTIDSRQVEVKVAVPKGFEKSAPNIKIRKLFLGGMSQTTTKEEAEEAINDLIKQHSKYEGFCEVGINTDKYTNKPRGFGFAVIKCEPEDEDTACAIVDDILRGQTYVKINERDVELKKAQPQDQMNKPPKQERFRDSRDFNAPGYDDYMQYGGRERMMMPGRGMYDRMASGYGYGPGMDAYMRSGYSAYGGGGMGSASTMDRGYGYTDPSSMSEYARYWGSYAQSGSNYAPTRGSYGDYKESRDRAEGRSAYHPYRRP